MPPWCEHLFVLHRRAEWETACLVEIEVHLDPHHLEALTRATPLTAITELIWNALDADATHVRVVLVENELQGVVEIRVEDDGHGMTHDRAVEGFQSLGGSWKRLARQSPGGRALHGREGQGRFRAAGLGSRVHWHTVFADPADETRKLAFDVEMRVTDLVHADITDPEPTDEAAGTRVVIDGFTAPPAGLGGEGPVEKLTGTFGLYLQTHGVHLRFGDGEIDPAAIQAHRREYEIDTGETTGMAKLTAVEWTRRVERAIYLCTEDGLPLGEVPAGIQAPGFEFTGYLAWSGFAEDEALVLANLSSGETQTVIEAAREQLREHFKERAAEETRRLIEDWKAEQVYPFTGDPATKAEKSARDLFDVVAVSASTAVNASDNKTSRRLSLRLLREALENDPGSLHKVLRDVLDLKQDRLEELSQLLDRSSLTALIETSKAIADRLEFLRGLESLVLDPDLSKVVKERSQLHRILAGETWVFGEEFALAADDETLTTVLKRHAAILGREELAPDEVLDHEGKRRIVDLMLARSLEQNRNRREHLVIELKAPKVPIGPEEASQIENYATAVSQDERFSTVDVEWDFYVVSTKVRGAPDLRRQSENAPYGQIMNAKGVRVWIYTWAEIIQDAAHRLKFVQQQLDYQPDEDQAFAYLRKTHAKYLPAQVTERASGSAAGPSAS